MMKKLELQEIRLIGIALPGKTTNENGQSSKDCGTLWQKFEQGDYLSKIPGRLSDEVIAVYHQYESDHAGPFSYFIGCKVNTSAEVPSGMESMTLPSGTYQKMIAKGKMPDCMTNAWKEIWESELSRTYIADFEVYDDRSKDWSNAEVDIFVSVQN